MTKLLYNRYWNWKRKHEKTTLSDMFVAKRILNLFEEHEFPFCVQHLSHSRHSTWCELWSPALLVAKYMVPPNSNWLIHGNWIILRRIWYLTKEPCYDGRIKKFVMHLLQKQKRMPGTNGIWGTRWYHLPTKEWMNRAAIFELSVLEDNVLEDVTIATSPDHRICPLVGQALKEWIVSRQYSSVPKYMPFLISVPTFDHSSYSINLWKYKSSYDVLKMYTMMKYVIIK